MSSDVVERHERVRADWLLHHKGSGFALSDQRMSNQLRKKANERERKAAGAAESAHHEAQIKPLVSRWIAGGEDQTDRGGRSFWVAVLALPALLAVGPMLAISKGLYQGYTESTLRRSNDGVQQIPKARLWLLVAAVAMVVAGILTPLFPVRVIQPWPWNVSYEPVNFVIVYAMWQIAFGALLTSWQVRRHGWPGVQVKVAADTSDLLNATVMDGYQPAARTTDTQPSTTSSKPQPADAAVEIEGFDDEFEDWMVEDEPEDSATTR